MSRRSKCECAILARLGMPESCDFCLVRATMEALDAERNTAPERTRADPGRWADPRPMTYRPPVAAK